MLTKEEMKRIDLEEIYREEVRKKLNENDQSSKFWKFINSSFGIWLLSTVVVGLVVYFYNDNKLQHEISANNAATATKLKTEIANRLQQFNFALSNQDPSKIYYQKKQLAYMIDGVLIIDGSLSPEKPIYIFPEYKERTMNSLLYEVGRLTSVEKEISDISEARKLITNIQSSLLNMEDEPRLEYSNQISRITQTAQMQPANLTQSDRKLFTEFQEREKNFKQKEVAEYHNRIKKKLDSLRDSFHINAYVKEILNK